MQQVVAQAEYEAARETPPAEKVLSGFHKTVGCSIQRGSPRRPRRTVVATQKSTGKKARVHGATYPSVRAAALATGIDRRQLGSAKKLR